MTDDIFSPSKETTEANRRKAIRYTSSCSKAIVILKQIFRPSKYINIGVINISSRGALISSRYKFRNKTKIIFKIKIRCDSPLRKSTWRVPAKIVRIYSKTEYGIIFDTTQHTLVDEIMRSEIEFSVAL